MNENDRKNITGVSVRNLPKDIADDQCQAFLESHGLPAGHTDVKINRMRYSSTIDAENLDAETCLKLLENLDQITAFDKKIYCKGISDVAVAVEVEATNEPLEDAKGTEPTPLSPQLQQLRILPINKMS